MSSDQSDAPAVPGASRPPAAGPNIPAPPPGFQIVELSDARRRSIEQAALQRMAQRRLQQQQQRAQAQRDPDRSHWPSLAALGEPTEKDPRP